MSLKYINKRFCFIYLWVNSGGLVMFLNVNNDKDISEVLNKINDALLESIYGK